MKFLIIYTLLIILNLSSALKNDKLYKGFKVYTVAKGLTERQFKALVDLQRIEPRLDFWSDPSHITTTDILVPPNKALQIQDYFTLNGIPYKMSINDVQKVVDRANRRENRQGSMNWSQYQKLNVIHSWLDSLAIQYPGLVEISSLGKTSESRDIKMLKISKSTTGTKKPGIFIDGGIHAREWISPATATYILNELLTNSDDTPELLDGLDWYFVPVINADGYEYTHNEDRLWRKSRSKRNGEECIGADLNRNFDFQWNSVGTNEDPCSNTYPGPHAFSEPEANATGQFILANKGKINAYITLHSYKQLFLTPYGYTEDFPDDYDDIYELGLKAAKALENVHGTEYEVGAPSHILYPNSGSSRDWVKGVPEIKYSFTIELRDKGESGFLLPDDEIQPTGEETWEAIKVIGKSIIKEAKDLYSGSSQDYAKYYGQVKYSYTIELRDTGKHKFLLPETQIVETGQEIWEAVKVIASHLLSTDKSHDTVIVNIGSEAEVDEDLENSAEDQNEEYDSKEYV